MILKCNCGTEEKISIHKDGLEVFKFVCNTCRRMPIAERHITKKERIHLLLHPADVAKR